ncbi:MAG: N-acetylmuramoyl-L-alanine amidase [Candidatus Binatia bacterium]
MHVVDVVWEVVAVREVRILAWAVAVAALVTVSCVSADAVNIQRIRHASGDEYTRIVIDIDGAAAYRAAFAAGDMAAGVPTRFYVDLTGAGIQLSMLGDLEVGDSRVARVRAGQFNEQTARVVMELSGPVVPKVFTLSSPARIVIDLENARPISGDGRVVSAGQRPTQAPAAVASVQRRVPAVPAAIPASVAPKQAAAVAASVVLPPSVDTLPAVVKPPDTVAVVAKAKAPRASVPAVAAAPLRSHGPWTIVIDPGHGGADPGALGPAGHREKDVTLAIAHKLAAKLRAGLGARVVLTRDGDATLTLAQRKDVANVREADLFISIHANASVRAEAEGIETYYLKNTNDRATLRLAKLENGVDPLIKGYDVSRDADLPFILSDMVQGSKESESIALARQIQSQLVRSIQPRYKGVRDLGVKQGPFYVLDGTYMPSVLVEAGFITHSAEGARIRTSSYQDLISEGIYRGIRRHVEDDSVAGVY